MPFDLVCTCGQKLRARDELQGRTLKCPKCSSPVTIPPGPVSIDSQTAKPSEGPSRPPPPPKPHPQREPIAEKACPICGARIPSNQVVCIKCRGTDEEEKRVGGALDDTGTAKESPRRPVRDRKVAVFVGGAILFGVLGIAAALGFTKGLPWFGQAFSIREVVPHKDLAGFEVTVRRHRLFAGSLDTGELALIYSVNSPSEMAAVFKDVLTPTRAFERGLSQFSDGGRQGLKQGEGRGEIHRSPGKVIYSEQVSEEHFFGKKAFLVAQTGIVGLNAHIDRSFSPFVKGRAELYQDLGVHGIFFLQLNSSEQEARIGWKNASGAILFSRKRGGAVKGHIQVWRRQEAHEWEAVSTPRTFDL